MRAHRVRRRRDVAPAARPGTYARARVRDLDRALTTALNRARALDYDLPRGRVLDLSRSLSGDLRRVRELAGDFDLGVELAVAARDLVRGLAGHRTFAVTDDGGHRARARALAHRLELDLGLFRGLAREFADARERADARESVRGRAERPAAAPVRAVDPVVAPARVAAGLVASAAHALPAASRARWREEFDGELRELAEAAVSWRAQVHHAARVSARVWSLRRAVRAPAPAQGGASG